MKNYVKAIFGLMLIAAFFCAETHSQSLVTASTSVDVGKVTTLYAHDPLGQSLCLTDGEYGTVIQGSTLRNRCSHLNFNSYSANAFQVGVQGSDRGVIVDLGSEDDLVKKYEVPTVVNRGNGYASLSVRNNKVYLLKDSRRSALQETEISDLLFNDGISQESASVKLGHVYILRIWDANNNDSQVLAKLIVTSFIPNESVTFRWQTLKNE